MKTFVAAFALASLIASSAWAKTEIPVTGAFAAVKADRTAVVVRQSSQHYVLMLGVAY
jgi:hypothetical protein